MTHGNNAEQRGSGESQSSPYGATGQRVGELALMLQGRLASSSKELPYEPGERPRWNDDDRLVFSYMLELKDNLAVLDEEFPAKGTMGSRFASVNTLNSSVAYPHHMWDWMRATRDAAWGVAPEEAYELIKRGGSFPYEELIMRRWKPVEGGGYDAYKMGAEWPEWRRELGDNSDPWLLIDPEEALSELGREMFSAAGQS